ncbi:hypothetical protein FGO68_gene2072 [Halteria grandinella]|uniref:Uncharacterized protein n=1 Tax=Halteria grandinella TaxID=5974 RepID=A0A8J8NUN4_HALGN|nr:hypothetical protein FGO68_gene2072 [Halteria grandinella]
MYYWGVITEERSFNGVGAQYRSSQSGVSYLGFYYIFHSSSCPTSLYIIQTSMTNSFSYLSSYQSYIFKLGTQFSLCFGNPGSPPSQTFWQSKHLIVLLMHLSKCQAASSKFKSYSPHPFTQANGTPKQLSALKCSIIQLQLDPSAILVHPFRGHPLNLIVLCRSLLYYYSSTNSAFGIPQSKQPQKESVGMQSEHIALLQGHTKQSKGMKAHPMHFSFIQSFCMQFQLSPIFIRSLSQGPIFRGVSLH